MTATLFRHLNEQVYKFSMITTEISSHIRYLLEEKGVRLLSHSESFVERRALLKHLCDGLFISMSEANETVSLNIWFVLNQ